jgi:hypothetical protein
MHIRRPGSWPRRRGGHETAGEGQQERVWHHSLSQGDEIRGAAVTGPGHYRRAEERAAEAHRLLGQGDDPGLCECLGRRGPGPCGAGSGRGHRCRRIRCGWPRLGRRRRVRLRIRPRRSLTHSGWSGHDRLGARFSVREQAGMLPVWSPALAGQGAGELEAVHLRAGPGSRGTRPGHGARDGQLHCVP